MHQIMLLTLAVITNPQLTAALSENDGLCEIEWGGFINCRNFKNTEDLAEGINKTLNDNSGAMEFSTTNKTLLLIETCNLEELAPSMLPMSKYVTKVYLHGNSINLLPKQAFRNMPKLKSVNINHNKIKAVSGEVFAGAENLKELIWKKNDLEEALPENIFEGLALLELLILKCVKNLTRTHFRGLNKLTHLDLAFNRLNRISEASFRDLYQLRHLYITDNAISVVDYGAFEGLGSLVVLNLRNNSIEMLPEGIFESLKSLEFLELSYNSLENVENGVFSQVPKLKVLHLNNNRIKAIESRAFEGLHSLTILWLFNNKLTTLDKTTFNGLDHLEVLRLDNNSIENLPANIYENLPSLEQLRVQGNKLASDVLQTIYRKYPEESQLARSSPDPYHHVYRLTEDS